MVSASLNPIFAYSLRAAPREGLEVSITFPAPTAAACACAARTSASPAPNPRAAASTTTSSIHALRPDGTSYHTRVSAPTTAPPDSAVKSAAEGFAATARSRSPEGASSRGESCGISRPNASSSESVTSVTCRTSSFISAQR